MKKDKPEKYKAFAFACFFLGAVVFIGSMFATFLGEKAGTDGMLMGIGVMIIGKQ